MFSFFSLLLLAAPAALGTVHAAPSTPIRRSVTPVSVPDLVAFTPFARFALAAYCPTSKLQGWKCGSVYTLHSNIIYASHPLRLIFADACNALPDFQPTLIGGDGNAVQICNSQLNRHKFLGSTDIGSLH
jgi:hypothetical protein